MTKKSRMVTRTLSNKQLPLHHTDYVLHKSQLSTNIDNVIDYSEHRLIRYTNGILDNQQKLVLFALLQDYRAGKIAISWCDGFPRYVRVTKEN